jgi:hypothetical protein
MANRVGSPIAAKTVASMQRPYANELFVSKNSSIRSLSVRSGRV